MTLDELNQIEARANVATAGPWIATEIPYDGFIDPCVVTKDNGSKLAPSCTDDTRIYICQTVYDMQSSTQEHNVDEDTEFIAHAREDIPMLIAEIRWLLAKQRR